ncbi:MAG: MlaD family protein [Bdellovibrionales bacterium]
MEPARKLQFKVGLLVSGALLLFVVSVLMLGGDGLFITKYNLKVKLEQVQGLGTGSVVNILGIKVGNVTDIAIIQEQGVNLVELTMEIDQRYQKQITEGSMADVRTQGALGDKYIYIIPGSATNPPLPHNGYLKSEGKGGILETLAESGDKLQKAFKIIDEMHVLMQNINGEGRSRVLMANLTASSESFKVLTKNLTSVVEKIDNGTGSLGALINDRSIYEGLKRFVGGSQDKNIKNVIRETIQSKKE